MASRDHYVSRFFLSQFGDPASSGVEPWLWYGELRNGTVKRKAQKNIGWSCDLFSGPGGLADRGRRLEEHLAQEVEGPAAQALREFVSAPMHEVREIPPALFRYLAWLATRSLTMKSLYESRIAELAPLEQIELVNEPPPQSANAMAAPARRHVMEHPQHGTRDDVMSDEIESLRRVGWLWRFSNDDFLEMVHLQAWDFQSRFFPRLSWKDGQWEVPPAALRHQRAELIIPVSHSRAIFGFNPHHDMPGSISPEAIDQVIGDAAHSWIAGPTEEVAGQAVRRRRRQINRSTTLRMLAPHSL